MEFNSHVFLSDVHLGAFPDAQNDEIENNLLSLISHCKQHRIALYILGDLFDYWMEFPAKNYVPKHGFEVLNALEDYNHSVKPVLYITGNHDNWTFGHFDKLGFDVEENHRQIQINNNHFLLMHGDGVSGSEFHYPRPLSHRILRNKTFVNLYQRLLSPKSGLNLMKWFSSQTRKRDIKDPEPLNKLASELIQNRKTDFFICGHDHIPRKIEFEQGTFFNCGAFYKHGSLVLYNNDTCSLVKWQSDSKNFIPFG